MPLTSGSDTLQRYVHVVVAVVFSVIVLYFGKNLFLLVLISGLFAFLLLPFARSLERWLPRWAGALIATLALLLVVLGLFFFLGWQFTHFGADLPLLQQKFASKGDTLFNWIEGRTHLDRRAQLEWFNAHLSELGAMGGKALMSLFSSTGSALGSLVPVPFFVFLLLLLKDRFRTFFTKLGATREGAVLGVMVHISVLSRKYLRGVITVAVIFGTLCSIGFLSIGLEYAVLLGFVLAFLNVIPYIGALIGSLLVAFVALVTKDSAWFAVAGLAVCFTVQFLDSTIITPKVVGSSVSINPLASMLALIGFGALWGVAGMVLAIPIMGMLKVVCDSIPSLHAWGYLLGEEIETPKEKRLHLSLPKRSAKPPVHDGPEEH